MCISSWPIRLGFRAVKGNEWLTLAAGEQNVLRHVSSCIQLVVSETILFEHSPPSHRLYYLQYIHDKLMRSSHNRQNFVLLKGL